MTKDKFGFFINIQAYKYDGLLYRQWNGVKVLADSEDYVSCLLNKTKVTEIEGQQWTISEPTLWFFSKKHFYNVTILKRKNGLYYYFNLASPFFYEANAIKYIDFDYDIKIYPQKAFLIVDHNDFLKNKEKWYNDDIIKTINKTLVLIAEKYQKREGIFDEYYVQQIFESLVILNEVREEHFIFDEEEGEKK